MSHSLSIVIPAYNESKRILNYLKTIDVYVSNKAITNLFNIIVVDDGSTDNTKDVVSKWIKEESKNKSHFNLISYFPNKGKGYAVREGFLKVDSDLVMYTDADGASPIEEVEKLLSCIEEGYDIACGSRILKDEDTKVRMGFRRRLVGLIFHLILRLLGLADLKDTQCGFKLFKLKIAKELVKNQKCFNYAFDVEYLFIARQLNFKIKEVGINWSHISGSKVSLLRDSIKMLLEVVKIRFIYKYNNV